MISKSENLKAQAIPVGTDSEKIAQVASISAGNNPEIGKLIAELDKVSQSNSSLHTPPLSPECSLQRNASSSRSRKRKNRK